METKDPQPAVFLDRDGTINEDHGYIHTFDQFHFINGSIEAIKRLKEAGFLAIVISNQSGIARGLYKPIDVDRLHTRVAEELLRHQTKIDAFFYCPHHPEGSDPQFSKVCDCRKPNTGMIRQAMETLMIDLDRSFVVGDHLSDVELAKNIGARGILLRTGHGLQQVEKLKNKEWQPWAIENDLSAAVNRIIKYHRGET